MCLLNTVTSTEEKFRMTLWVIACLSWSGDKISHRRIASAMIRDGETLCLKCGGLLGRDYVFDGSYFNEELNHCDACLEGDDEGFDSRD